MAGLVPVPKEWESLNVSLLRTGFNSVEPTGGVLRDGSIVMVGETKVPGASSLQPSMAPYLSSDGGHTWAVLPSPLAANQDAGFDPWIWVDHATDRIFHVGTHLACVYIAWSDDHGATWNQDPAACGIAASTYSDHESLVTGPPPHGTQTTGYPNIVYVARNGGPGAAVSILSPTQVPVLGSYSGVSLDGGQTFLRAALAHPQDPCEFGVQGPVHVANGGVAYFPKSTCYGTNIAVSRDAGLTWTITGHLEAHGSTHALQNPHVATDEAGTAYAVYQGNDGLVYMNRGTNDGTSWDSGIRVTPPGIHATMFTQAVASAPGHVAILYHGTRNTTEGWTYPEADWAPPRAVWHTFLTFSVDANTPDPTFITVQVTPDGDPVMVGCASLGLQACTTGTCSAAQQAANGCVKRTLNDFFGMDARNGKVYGFIEDACDHCHTQAESTRTDGYVIVAQGMPW